jgi:hypothetical protein
VGESLNCLFFHVFVHFAIVWKCLTGKGTSMSFAEHQQTAIRYVAFARLPALFSTIVLAGCITATPIVADDPHVFLPSIRASISLDEGKQAPAEPQTGRAVEFEFAKARGSGNQFLASGQSPIIFNNVTFSAPQQLRNDFDFNYADISFRWRKFFRERSFGLEVSGGIGHTSLGLTVSSPTQSASGHYGTYGPQGGIALIWRVQPSTSIHARISGFVSKSSTGISDLGRYEIFVAQALGDNLALRAGYAKWEVNGTNGEFQSDFRTTFSGPVLDLGLNF